MKLIIDELNGKMNIDWCNEIQLEKELDENLTGEWKWLKKKSK